MESNKELIENLVSKSSAKRQRAYRLILKNNTEISDLCNSIALALEMELNGKNWKAKIQILNIVEKYNCTACVNTVKNILLEEEDFSMILLCATKVFIRLNSSSLETIKSILSLSKYSATEGVFEVLGYDNIDLPEEFKLQLIKEYSDFGKNRIKGLTDPRYGLALACQFWSDKITDDFLMKCSQSQDIPLSYISEKILNNKKFKPRKES